MKIKVKSNLAGGLFCILFSIILWIIIPIQVSLNNNNTFIDARFMPKFMAIVIFIAGIMLVVQSRLKEDKMIEINLNNELKSFLYIVVLIIYALLLSNLGFVISSIFLGIMTLLLLKTTNRKYYIIILGLVFVLKVVFNYLLKVPLP